MLFEVRRTTTQVGTFKADSPSDALTIAKEKFERAVYDQRAEFAVREVREMIEMGPQPEAAMPSGPEDARVKRY